MLSQRNLEFQSIRSRAHHTHATCLSVSPDVTAPSRDLKAFGCNTRWRARYTIGRHRFLSHRHVPHLPPSNECPRPMMVPHINPRRLCSQMPWRIISENDGISSVSKWSALINGGSKCWCGESLLPRKLNKERLEPHIRRLPPLRDKIRCLLQRTRRALPPH
jgi:hypothetical protein